ncbi:Immunoglobulin I-set [Trinorchestia longiramus]|nr:Immunoglobulin I-set [Trinorchestia longiramus]
MIDRSEAGPCHLRHISAASQDIKTVPLFGLNAEKLGKHQEKELFAHERMRFLNQGEQKDCSECSAISGANEYRVKDVRKKLNSAELLSRRWQNGGWLARLACLPKLAVFGIFLVLLCFSASPVTAQYTESGAWEGIENNTAVNVSAQMATTAFLPCAVRMIGDKQISWIRKRDWHVLTSGLQSFTNDARFSVTHQDGADDWTLTIKFLQKRDNGTYECQISTASGIVSQFVHLHVIVPEAFILGNSEYHVQTGSAINLFCIIEQSPIPPQFVSWKHNERLLNYDNYRGGVSVKTDHGPKTSSRLIISGATVTDSGNYSCAAPHTEPATVHVFVSQATDVSTGAHDRIDICLCVLKKPQTIATIQLRDLIIINAENLNHGKQMGKNAKNATWIFDFIARKFGYQSKNAILLLYKVETQSRREYAVHLWSPTLRRDVKENEKNSA